MSDINRGAALNLRPKSTRDLTWKSPNDRELLDEDVGFFITSKNEYHTWRRYNWGPAKNDTDRLLSVIQQREVYNRKAVQAGTFELRSLERASAQDVPFYKTWKDVKLSRPTVFLYWYSDLDKKMWEKEFDQRAQTAATAKPTGNLFAKAATPSAPSTTTQETPSSLVTESEKPKAPRAKKEKDAQT